MRRDRRPRSRQGTTPVPHLRWRRKLLTRLLPVSISRRHVDQPYTRERRTIFAFHTQEWRWGLVNLKRKSCGVNPQKQTFHELLENIGRREQWQRYTSGCPFSLLSQFFMPLLGQQRFCPNHAALLLSCCLKKA